MTKMFEIMDYKNVKIKWAKFEVCISFFFFFLLFHFLDSFYKLETNFRKIFF